MKSETLWHSERNGVCLQQVEYFKIFNIICIQTLELENENGAVNYS